MGIIIILIAISLSIAILFLIIFYWSMNSGQYDDTYTPGVRMLFDHKTTKTKTADGEPAVSGPPLPPDQIASDRPQR